MTKLIRSEQIFSPQSYCEIIFGECFIFNGNKDELRIFLDKNGHSNLWDYPLNEIDNVIENEIPVVLVDTTYTDDETGKMIHEYRWFQVPDDYWDKE